MTKKRIELEIGGIEVSVSSPDKVYFPELGITKLEVVEYYRSVAQAALRAAGGRPMVLKRYVNGVAKEAFYQKRAPPTRPPWVDTVTLRFPSGRKADEVVLNNEAQLVWAVNLGCIETHVHPVRADDLEHPDELRVDLDPVPGVEWPQIRDVGFVTKAVLEDLGLVGWPKTSGSRGLHVYVRIQPRWTFTEVRRAALAIAREVERRAPDIATSKWWKEERHGVFLDYNQNAKDRTIAAAWSVRPVPDARVSMPITWAELEAVDPAQFNLRTAPSRLAEIGDPQAEMHESPADLMAAMQLVADQEAEGQGDAAWPPHYIKGEDEPTRAQPSRRRRVKLPVIEIGRAKQKAEGLAGLERWRARHPEVVPHLQPADVLVDRMRGRHSEWTRVRVNLQHVPEGLRPAQGPLDPDYDVGAEWGMGRDDGGELPRLPGVSRNKQVALRDALGVTSVEELEEAARAGRVRAVKGFGPKTEAKILEAIAAQRDRAGHWRAQEGLQLVGRVRAALEDAAERVEAAGPLRRGVEIVQAVELVVAAASSADVQAALTGLGEVEVGPDALTLHVDGAPPARISVVAPQRFGAAWQAASAAEAHLDALRARAADRGLSLSSDGLFSGGASVPTPDESTFAAALGVPLVPPELRETPEVLERAEAFEGLLSQEDLRGMVHCHTTWSDGQHTIEQMARAAEAMGFAYITITDHSHSAFYANGLTPAELERQCDEIDEVQARVGIRILKGTESDILLDGALDFPDAVLERLDVVIASVHSRFKLDAAKMTERLVRAMKKPVFKIWGHPLGRLLLRREPVGLDLDAVLDAIAGSPAAIEINADPHRLDLPAEQIRMARARGIRFVVSADAHSVPGLEVLEHGVRIARRAGLRRDEVLNTLDAGGFAAAVRPAR